FRGDFAPGFGPGARDFDYTCKEPTVAYVMGSSTSELVGAVHCTWVVAFAVVPGDVLIRSSDPVYDLVKQEWQLNPSMLLRPYVDLPEYIEIDGPATLTFTTDMKQVAPRVWRLPAAGMSYSMTIGNAGTAPRGH